MYHLLTSTITVYTPSGEPDSDGKQAWVIDRDIPCRYVRKREFVLGTAKSGGKGEEILFTDNFIIADETLPEGTVFKYGDKAFNVISCQEWKGEDSSEVFGSMIYASNSVDADV